MKTGINNPDMIDLITHNATDEEYVLIISEPRNWNGSDAEQELLLKKLNNYLHFALNGQLERSYLDSAGKSVKIQIDCASIPPASIDRLITQAQALMVQHNIKLTINLLE